MKIILIFILLSSSLAYSQRSLSKYYGSLGVGFSFPNTDKLNQILNYYNQTNTTLIKKFEDFGMIFGPSFLFGVSFDKEKSTLALEFGFSIKFSSKKTSESRENGIVKIRDVAIKFPMAFLGGQYLGKINKSFDIGVGVYFNFGSMNLFTRTYNRGSSSPVYSKIGDNNFFSGAGITPSGFFNIHLGKQFIISIRPSYNIMLTNQDLSQLNSILNPGSNINGINEVNFSGPGIDLNLLVKLGR